MWTNGRFVRTPSQALASVKRQAQIVMSRTALFCMVLVGVSGCGDDGGDASSDGSTTEAQTSTGPSTSMTASTATTSSTNPATTDETSSSETTDGTTVADSSSTSDTAADSSSTGTTEDPGTYAALVRGPLFTDDLDEAQMLHDQIAGGGQRDVMAAGDFGHDALLGTTLLGSPMDAFLGLDQWDNLAGAQATYADPEFQAAFGMLFARMPTLELFQLSEDWHSWGELESADGGDFWFVVVRGHLAEENLDDAQAAHDPLAAAGEADAMAAGDVSHLVWHGVEDEREVLLIDVWNDDTNIEAFYGNPDFQAAFGMLFDAQPTVAVYRSTDWVQW